MAVAIKPLEDRIVVKALEAEKTTASRSNGCQGRGCSSLQ
jgi:hypothetical protein